MGGAGGTVYETPDGPRTGAYLASRVARDVVERADARPARAGLEPQRRERRRRICTARCSEALVERLDELKAPPSGLRSRLLRALPTTMAAGCAATYATGRIDLGLPRALGRGFSGVRVRAGTARASSRTDDLRDPGDAWTNLRRDSVVSNAMSADTEFHVSYRKVELQAPFLVVVRDGRLLRLRAVTHALRAPGAEPPVRRRAASTAGRRSLQEEITAVTGDDAAMSMLGVGADLKEFQALFAPRVEELERQFIAPLDELRSGDRSAPSANCRRCSVATSSSSRRSGASTSRGTSATCARNPSTGGRRRRTATKSREARVQQATRVPRPRLEEASS